MKRVLPQVWLPLVCIAVLAPFLNKAFHIDDPLFLWMADQITRHPFDPYGFRVNWIGAPEPMWSAMQNPPLCSYFIAAISSLFGQSEVVLHAAFLLWAILAVLGTFALARRFGLPPVVAALSTLFMPVFLVSATNVMCDIMLLALYTWAIVFWLSGLEKGHWWYFGISAFLASTAAQTKYFGISVVALLAVYSVSRERRLSLRLFWLALPIAITLLYDWWTRTKYGHPLFTGATHYSQMISARYASSFPKQFLLGCCFLGGCFFSAFFFLPFNRKIMGTAGLVLIIAVLSFRFAFPPGDAIKGNYMLVVLEGGIFAAIAWIIFVFLAREIWRKRDADSLLLGLWIMGTFAFATFLNWSVTARTMLPAAPAVAILLARLLPRKPGLSATIIIRIGLAAAVSIAVTVADYRIANTAREAAHQFRERFHSEPGTIWFQSHWGFQFYMQQWGARALNMFNSEITSGDVMIIPANNTAVINIPPDKVYPPEKVNFETMPLLSTIGLRTGGSFYTSVRGPLPWVVGRVPAEMYYVARFR